MATPGRTGSPSYQPKQEKREPLMREVDSIRAAAVGGASCPPQQKVPTVRTGQGLKQFGGTGH